MRPWTAAMIFRSQFCRLIGLVSLAFLTYLHSVGVPLPFRGKDDRGVVVVITNGAARTKLPPDLLQNNSRNRTSSLVRNKRYPVRARERRLWMRDVILIVLDRRGKGGHVERPPMRVNRKEGIGALAVRLASARELRLPELCKRLCPRLCAGRNNSFRQLLLHRRKIETFVKW